jgi:peroxiredoxin family protein
MSDRPKRLAMIASRGSLDWAYPPFLLASTAAAMEMEVAVFFTFYGLPLLRKKLDLSVTPFGNPAMPMPVPMPNALFSMPGMDAIATSMMKNKFKAKGVAAIEELRQACIESGVRLIGCQMTMDVFGFTADQFIDGIELGGAATFLEVAADSDISLFI